MSDVPSQGQGRGSCHPLCHSDLGFQLSLTLIQGLPGLFTGSTFPRATLDPRDSDSFGMVLQLEGCPDVHEDSACLGKLPCHKSSGVYKQTFDQRIGVFEWIRV